MAENGSNGSKILEILKGISQAASKSFDGALDDDGKPMEIGFKREGRDARKMPQMDGASCRVQGYKLIVSYHSQVRLQDVYKGGHGGNKSQFENDIRASISDYVTWLKKQYKKVAGGALELTDMSEPDIRVERSSAVRVWATAGCTYTISSLKKLMDDSGDKDIEKERKEKAKFTDEGGHGKEQKGEKNKRGKEPKEKQPKKLDESINSFARNAVNDSSIEEAGNQNSWQMAERNLNVAFETYKNSLDRIKYAPEGDPNTPMNMEALQTAIQKLNDAHAALVATVNPADHQTEEDLNTWDGLDEAGSSEWVPVDEREEDNGGNWIQETLDEILNEMPTEAPQAGTGSEGDSANDVESVYSFLEAMMSRNSGFYVTPKDVQLAAHKLQVQLNPGDVRSILTSLEQAGGDVELEEGKPIVGGSRPSPGALAQQRIKAGKGRVVHPVGGAPTIGPQGAAPRIKSKELADWEAAKAKLDREAARKFGFGGEEESPVPPEKEDLWSGSELVEPLEGRWSEFGADDYKTGHKFDPLVAKQYLEQDMVEPNTENLQRIYRAWKRGYDTAHKKDLGVTV